MAESGDFFPLQVGHGWAYAYKATETTYIAIVTIEQIRVDSGVVRFSIVSSTPTDSATTWTILERDSVQVHIQDLWHARDTTYLMTSEETFYLTERLDSLHSIGCQSHLPPLRLPIEYFGAVGSPMFRFGPDTTSRFQTEQFQAGMVYTVRDSFSFHRGIGIVKATAYITKGPNIPYSLVWSADLLSTATAIEAASSGDIEGYGLLGNYPNPFNSSTTFCFQVNRHASTLLEVFDALGRNIAVLIRADLSPGAYRVPWDARSYASGVYHCRLAVGATMNVRRVLLLK
jgi:hypothetical protein